MAYYEELNAIVDNIIGEKILRNQKLCKLLTYYPELSEPNFDMFASFDYPVFEQPDILNTNYLYMRYVYPLPKMPDAKTEQKTYMTIVASGGYEMDTNKGFRRVNLLVDIICHLDVWKVREGYRPYLIMSEMDKMLNNKLTDLPIENKPYSRGYQPRDYSNYFYGFQMIYELIVNSNILCSAVPQNLNLGADQPNLPLLTVKK